jgi:hypothetical protein
LCIFHAPADPQSTHADLNGGVNVRPVTTGEERLVVALGLDPAGLLAEVTGAIRPRGQ